MSGGLIRHSVDGEGTVHQWNFGERYAVIDLKSGMWLSLANGDKVGNYEQAVQCATGRTGMEHRTMILQLYGIVAIPISPIPAPGVDLNES